MPVEHGGRHYNAHISFARYGKNQRPLARCILLTDVTDTVELLAETKRQSELLREANALVRAAAYKKRVEIQNQDTTEAGLEAVKSLVWQAMAKERPDLYRQVNEFLNSKKQDG